MPDIDAWRQTGSHLAKGLKQTQLRPRHRFNAMPPLP
jgi:hypothetical protein